MNILYDNATYNHVTSMHYFMTCNTYPIIFTLKHIGFVKNPFNMSNQLLGKSFTKMAHYMHDSTVFLNVYVHTYIRSVYLYKFGCGILCHPVEDHCWMVYTTTDSEVGAAEVLGVRTSYTCDCTIHCTTVTLYVCVCMCVYVCVCVCVCV